MITWTAKSHQNPSSTCMNAPLSQWSKRPASRFLSKSPAPGLSPPRARLSRRALSFLQQKTRGSLVHRSPRAVCLLCNNRFAVEWTKSIENHGTRGWQSRITLNPNPERQVSGGCIPSKCTPRACTPPSLPRFSSLTVFAFAQGAEHVAADARAAAADNSRAGPVFISGAAGPYSAAINGFYTVTEEKSSDGRVVMSKRSDANICIEHFFGKWQVKPVSNKGQNACMALVEGGCALEDCTSRVWMVGNEKVCQDVFIYHPSVKMVTGSDAERQVSGGCIPSKCTPRACTPFSLPRCFSYDGICS
jgi:hypothetical protein